MIDHGLVLAELDGVAGVLDERGDIGADEHLAVADAEHQRVERRAATIVPGSSALAKTRVKWPSRRRSTASTEAAKSPAVSPWWYRLGDQVHRDLGVGVAGELDALGLQLAAQRGEVLDDAVVDDRDLAGGVAVRVGIAVGGPAVGGPPGVSEPGVPGQRCRRRSRRGPLPGWRAARRGVAPSAPPAVDQRDAGRVVAAVLHPAQRIDDDIAGGTLPDVPDDSTHSATPYARRMGKSTKICTVFR